MGYDDYRPTSEATVSKDASSAVRTIQVRADTEADALGHADAPQYGEALAWGTGYLYCSTVTTKQVAEAAPDSTGAFLWDVTATYATLDKVPVEGKARWSISGQNETIKLKAVADAAHAVHYLYGGGSAPALGYQGLAIGLTDKGVDGCDVDDPFEVLRLDLWLAPGDVAAKLATIRSLKNTVNDDSWGPFPWGTLAAGQARLHTYQVSHVNGELDQVSIEFLIRENVEFGIDLADGTAHTVAKEGHDYYWQRMQQRTASGEDTEVDADIIDAHLAKVYEDGDFDGLSIDNSMFDFTSAS
jgi:hypothetical protein